MVVVLSLSVVFVVVLGAAVVLVGAGLRWLRRWQADLQRQQAALSQAAISSLRSEQSHQLSGTVDTVVSVANERLGSHLALGTQQVTVRQEALDAQLASMTGELRRVNDLVATLQKERAEQHGQLVSGLREHALRSAELAQSAQDLRHALSSPKARGQWGERMAEDVLRLAGLVEGVSYRKQVALAGGTIPDFTFLLPNGWKLHMDVKFPIDNYLRVLGATSDAERATFTASFGRDVRARIKELGGRGYIERGETLDYVLAFIPNEAVYSFVHEQDPALVDDALRRRVVLCSPFTLFAVLAVIRQSVEQLAIERTSDEILRVLGGFNQQWEKFSDSMDGLGRKLDTAQKAFEELSGTRRRQLQRSLDKVEDLRTRAGLGIEGEPAPVTPPAPVAPALRAVVSGV